MHCKYSVLVFSLVFSCIIHTCTETCKKSFSLIFFFLWNYNFSKDYSTANSCSNFIIYFININKSRHKLGILASCLGESWIHHLCLRLANLKKKKKKNALVGLMTFGWGLIKILYYKNLCLDLVLSYNFNFILLYKNFLRVHKIEFWMSKTPNNDSTCMFEYQWFVFMSWILKNYT